jgi:2-octaprenyl-6-methoxyphenol hydroxylase
MTQALPYDVVIAGGSHVGLALALALVRLLGRDVRIAVIERRPLEAASPSDDPRGFAIAAASKNLLAAIGVWSAVAERAQPVTAIDVTDSALEHAIRPVLLSWPNATATGAPATWIVEAPRLSHALLDAVRRHANIELVAPAQVAAVAVDQARATVVLADGREIAGRLLVAADGARSFIREAIEIDTVRWRWGQVGLVTVVRHERPHGAKAIQHFLPGGPFAILPLMGNRSCITWSEDEAEGRRIMALDDAGFLAEVTRRFGYRLGEIGLDGPRALWPLEHHMARALVGRRVALVGDAARVVHPIAGQGLNLGLRDVAALAEVVAGSLRVGLDAGDATGLERYERWRRFDAGLSAATFGALNVLFSNDSMLLRAARGVGLGVVDRLPDLKEMFVAEAAGLTGEVPRLMRDPAASIAL